MNVDMEHVEAIEDLFRFEYTYHGRLTDGPLNLALVLLNEKSGTSLRCDAYAAPRVEEVLQKLPIEFIAEGEPTRNHLPFIEMYVTADTGNFKQLEKRRREETSHTRAMGNFFGYPEEAVEFFVTSDNPTGEFNQFLEHQTILSPEEYQRKYWMVNYIPAPSSASLERAKATQDSYIDTIRSSNLSELLEYHYGRLDR